MATNEYENENGRYEGMLSLQSQHDHTQKFLELDSGKLSTLTSTSLR